jgi:hypothetical protein
MELVMAEENVIESVDQPVMEDQSQELPVEQPVEGAGEQDQAPNNDWAVKRIGQITAKRHEAERQRDALNSENATLREQLKQFANGQTPEALPADEVERRASQLATERAHQMEFNNRCNSVAEQGGKEFGQAFNQSIANLQAAGVTTNEFLDVATQLDDSAKVLHYLGQHPDEAMRIAELSPARMAMELTKLSSKAGQLTSKPVSKAPAPITPVDGIGGASSGYSDSDDIGRWMEQRNKEAGGRKRY